MLTLAWSGASAQLIDEVTVTAQKREQSAQEIPISIRAFTGDQLNELGVTAARELADYTAGVQINMEYGNAPTFTIRGVNVNDFGAGTSPAAAVYVDGIFKASNINSGPQLFDLERVEILKGPQGTSMGQEYDGRRYQCESLASQPAKPRVISRSGSATTAEWKWKVP